MVSQEYIGSTEAVVIYFASIRYHLQKAFPINHSQSQPFCLVTEREAAVRYKTKRLHGQGDQFPTSSISRLLCRHERSLPTKELNNRSVTKQRVAAQD